MISDSVSGFMYFTSKLKFILNYKTISKFTAVIFILIVNLHAQGNEFQFTHLTAEDGLSLNAVTKIIQDDKGFLWFGTYNGLNRYDGYSFKTFLPDNSNPNSISNNSIWALYKDSKGSIWVGTLDGLNRYDSKTEQFYKYKNNPDDPNSISHNSITSVFEDKSGTLWIGTRNGLNKYNKDKNNFTVIKKVSDRLNGNSLNTVTSIEEDSRGNLWIGTWNGLTCMSKDGKIIKQFFSEKSDSAISDFEKIPALLEDGKNNLWIGVNGFGISKLNHETGKFVNYFSSPVDKNSLSNSSVTSMFKDRSGNIWVGTRDGLNLYNFNNDKFTRFFHDPDKPLSIINNEILSINEDNTGIIWIGSSGGLNRYYQPDNNFNYFLEGNKLSGKNLISNRVHSICADEKENLWVATFKGLDEIIKGGNRILHFNNNSGNKNGLNENYLISVIADHLGYIWVGTSKSGLNRFNPVTKEFKLFHFKFNDTHSLSNNGIVSLCEDHYGNLWVGTWWGLNYFNRKNESFTRYFHDPANTNSLCHDAIWTVFEDSKGMMWFGTDGGGASEFSPKTNKFITFSRDLHNPNHISENRVFTICESHDGIIWLGTSDGLNAYNRTTGKITIYNKSDGLPGNSISSILEDNNGCLWIGTNKGLSKFNRKTGLFINYTTRNGLKDLEFDQNVTSKSINGDLYFGCKSGIVYFNPENIKDENLEAPVVLTDLKIFNQSVPITKEGILKESITGIKSISIPSGNSVITLEFALLDYFDVKKNTFRYKLEGFDNDWNNVGSRNNATYTNIPPGEYTFLVRALNSNGIIDERKASLKIIIIPKFYETLWFKIALIVGTILSTLLYIHLRTIKIRDLNKVLENRVADRTKDLDEKITELNREIIERKKAEEAVKASLNEKETLLEQIHLREKNNLQIQLQLRESESRYRELFEMESDAILLVDNETGKILDANHAASVLYGYKHGELLSMTNQDLSNEPEKTTKILNMFLSGTNQVYTISSRYHRKKNGTVFPVEISGRSFIRMGRSVHIAAIRDITERKQAEEELLKFKDHLLDMVEERTAELEQSRETFRALSENTKDVIIRVNNNFQFLYANAALGEVFGIRTNEYLGKTLFELDFSKNLAKGFESFLNKVFETKQNSQVEFQLPNGNWIDVLAIPEFDAEGNVCSIITSSRDITELKNLQLEIENALEKEKELNQLKDRFISMVSHEYRTPLTSILSSIELLELGDEKYTKEKKKVHFNRIQKNVDYLINMIDEVLYVNRIDSKRIGVSFQKISLPDFCTEIFDEMKSLYPGIKSTINIDLKKDYYNIDAAIMKKILGNLISNAYKYNNENGSVCFNVKSEMNNLVFKVTDGGIGIPEEEQKNLFEPFSRMTNSQNIKGTGLGLSIVKKSVEQLNGTISFTSRQDEGSTFIVTIPNNELSG
jgi:PAS domain S-box-containing protein